MQRARCISFFSFDYNSIYHTSATWLLLLLNFCMRLDYASFVRASDGGGILSNTLSDTRHSCLLFFLWIYCASHIHKPAIKHANRAYVIFCVQKLYASCDLRHDKKQCSSSWARYRYRRITTRDSYRLISRFSTTETEHSPKGLHFIIGVFKESEWIWEFKIRTFKISSNMRLSRATTQQFHDIIFCNSLNASYLKPEILKIRILS